MDNLISSALGTAIAEFTTLPICTLKTRYQSSDSKDMFQLARRMVKNEGLKAFYNASIPSITSQVFTTSSRWYLYNFAIDEYKKKYGNPQIYNNILFSVGANVSISLVTHPLDFIKIHLQNKEPVKFRNIYRGYSKTLSKYAVGGATFFPIYTSLNDSLRNPILASFMTSIISVLILHPIDYLKVRHIGDRLLYHGFNIASYYKGLGLNLMRTVPHFTITMSLTEYFKFKIPVMREQYNNNK